MPLAGSSTVSPRRGIGDFDHEAHDRARRIELAGIAGRVTHLAQHGLIERAKRVQLVATT